MGRPEQATRSGQQFPEREIREIGILGGDSPSLPPSSQPPVLPGQISGGGILGAPTLLPNQALSGKVSTTSQLYPYSQTQGGIQTVIQGGIEYQQIPVERVEYQTVPIKVTDYQQVAVPIQNVQTYQTPVMRESYRAGGYFEYVPFERSYYENVPVERVEYVPVEKRYTDYYAIEKQYEYIPNVSYENYREYVPQQKTEYVAQTKVEYVPQVSTEMVPVDRVQERVDYQTVEKTLVHYPQVERQFVIDAESSGRIRRDLVGTVVQPTAGNVVNRGGVIGGSAIGGNVLPQGFVGGPASLPPVQQGFVGGPASLPPVQQGFVGGPASLPPVQQGFVGGPASFPPVQQGFVGGPASLPPSVVPGGQLYSQPPVGFPQGGFAQGYSQPPVGFSQGGFVQGYSQPPVGAFPQGVQGYGQSGLVQGYGQSGLVQPRQAFGGAYPQKNQGFAGPLLGGNLAVSQPLGQPVAGGLINTGAKDGVGLRKGSLADRLANQLKQ